MLSGFITDEGQSILNGGLGNDQLVVGGGNLNLLHGGEGDDYHLLGAGVDVFHFDLAASEQGADTIENFDRTADQLALRGLTPENVLSVVDDGTDVLVAFALGGSIRFEGMGTGLVDELSDLVDDPGQISDAWLV